MKKFATIYMLVTFIVMSLAVSISFAGQQVKESEMPPISEQFRVPPKLKKLPDLVISDIKLIKDVKLNKDCQVQITIKNVGTGGVPDSGYHKTQGAAIQMYNGNQPWGGIRLFIADPAKVLKNPGTSVTYDWMPGSLNLYLTPGTHTIKTVVDNNNAVAESNENNNSRTERLTCRKRVYSPRPSPGLILQVTYPAGSQTGSQEFNVVNNKIQITVRFNKAVDQTTVVPRSSFLVNMEKDHNAAGTISWINNRELTWTSNQNVGDLCIFDSDCSFSLTITDSVRDAGGPGLGGQRLDGDRDGNPGGNFTTNFIIIG